MPQKRAGHKEALKRDPTGPYARGFRARKGKKDPFPPVADQRWAKREWKSGQAAKGRPKR